MYVMYVYVGCFG